MSVREDKYLIIQYAPYSFVYSDRLDDDSDFFDFRTYDNFDKVVIPYPVAIKLLIKDRSKTHFNLEEVANIRTSGPMAFVTLGWQALSQPFAAELKKLLDVSRLKVRLSFNSGRTFQTGELQTKIKQENLTGYNEIHLAKVEMTYLTKLDPFLIESLFGAELEGPVGVTEEESILGTETGAGLGV